MIPEKLFSYIVYYTRKSLKRINLNSVKLKETSSFHCAADTPFAGEEAEPPDMNETVKAPTQN